MIEKLLLAATLTLSLNVFVRISQPTTSLNSAKLELQQSIIQTISYLPR